MQTKKFQPAEFDPTFIEEAAFLLIKEKEEAGDRELSQSFHAEKDDIYESIPRDEREDSFKILYRRFFVKLGLEKYFKSILDQFPIIKKAHPVITFKRVWSSKQEGTELYIDGTQRTLVINLQVARVLDLSYLESYLLFELMHISDMLDPPFDYSPHPNLGGVGKVEDELVRDRFRLLWDFYISTRLVKQGHASLIPLEKMKRDIELSFSHWAPQVRGTLIQDLMGSKDWTQQSLIELAKDDRFNKVLGEGGLRCPLCHFSSYESKNNWAKEERTILDAIRKDHPDWNPALGACSQCHEMYVSKMRLSV